MPEGAAPIPTAENKSVQGLLLVRLDGAVRGGIGHARQHEAVALHEQVGGVQGATQWSGLVRSSAARAERGTSGQVSRKPLPAGREKNGEGAEQIGLDSLQVG